MKRFVDLLQRFRWLFVLSILIISTLFALAIDRMGLKMDNSPERFAVADDPRFVAYQSFQDEFGRDDAFAFVIQGSVFTENYINTLEELEVKTRVHCSKSTSFHNTPLLLETEQGMRFVLLKKALSQGISNEKLVRGIKLLKHRIVDETGDFSIFWCMNQKRTFQF